MPPDYHLPAGTIIGLALDVLSRRRRAFEQDAHTLIRGIQPALVVYGSDCLPRAGPYLITCNHYSRPGFRAWWLPMAISASVPTAVHWVITSAWTFPGRRLAKPLRRVSTWLLEGIAHTYGFTRMPPMPPDPAEVQQRARAVRRVLEYARRQPAPVIGLAPEGRDIAGGLLGQPPPGAGRFALGLMPYCKLVLPAAVFEDTSHLCVSFGQPYALEVPGELGAEGRDRLASQQIMQAIARLLPARLRGAYL